jgi:L-lactate dehydrogenase
MKVGIIGLGWVGSSVAISLLHKGVARELLLNDINMARAEGEAMDFKHGAPFLSAANVKAVEIPSMVSCDAVIVTAGRGGVGEESRLQLLKDNISIVKSIADQLKGFKGLLIVLANPVDVLTYYYQKFTGLPANRVIGTGTMLDSARLRQRIGEKLSVDAKSIHAQVVGEHGDSEVVLWSRAMLGGMSLRSWPDWNQSDEKRIEEEVRTAAYEIIKRKGATNHAIGLVTATLIKWLLRGEQRIVTLSSVVDNVYGMHDVAISVPVMVDRNGIVQVLTPEITDKELEGLQLSGEIIKKAIESVR